MLLLFKNLFGITGKPTQPILASIINPRLVKSGKFGVFLFFSFLIIFAYTIPFTFIPLRATEEGISLQLTALLLSISGVTSMTGRVAIGIVAGNLPRACPWLIFLFVLISGLIMNVLPFANTYIGIAFLEAIFMLCTGKNVIKLLKKFKSETICPKEFYEICYSQTVG